MERISVSGATERDLENTDVSLQTENEELKARIEAITNLVEALQKRKDSVAIENEALKISIESKQIENSALLKEIEPLKKIIEELKATNEQLQATIEELRTRADSLAARKRELEERVAAIKEGEEAKKRSDEAVHLRNEQMRKSEQFAEFVRAKASGVRKIHVNGKEITARLVRVFLEIAGRGSMHVFEMSRSLGIPRSTITRDLGILRGMKWVCLKGSFKFGAYVLTDEGKSAIEQFGVKTSSDNL